jgi:hypothetical protein
MNDLMEQYKAQILALQKEVERLNIEMEKFKDLAFKAKLSDPNYYKPIHNLEVNGYEIITQ